MKHIWCVRELPCHFKKTKFSTFTERLLESDICDLGEKNKLKLEENEGIVRVYEKGKLDMQALISIKFRKEEVMHDDFFYIYLPASEFQCGSEVFGLVFARSYDKRMLKMSFPSVEGLRLTLEEKNTGNKLRHIDFDPENPIFKIKFEENWNGMFILKLEKKSGEGVYEELTQEKFRISKLEKNNISLLNLPDKKYLVSNEIKKHLLRAKYSYGQPVKKLKNISLKIRPDEVGSEPSFEHGVEEELVESCNREGDFEIPIEINTPGSFHYDLIVEDEHGRKGSASGDFVVAEGLVKVQVTSDPQTEDPKKEEEEDSSSLKKIKKKKKEEDGGDNETEKELYKISMMCEKGDGSTYNTKNKIVVRILDCFGVPQDKVKVMMEMVSKNAAFISCGNASSFDHYQKKAMISKVEVYTKNGEIKVPFACEDDVFQVNTIVVTKEGFKIKKTASLACVEQKDWIDVFVSKFGNFQEEKEDNIISISQQQHQSLLFNERDMLHIRAKCMSFKQQLKEEEEESNNNRKKKMKFVVLDFNGIVDTFTKEEREGYYEMYYPIPDRLKGKKVLIQCFTADTGHVNCSGEAHFEVLAHHHFFTPKLIQTRTKSKEFIAAGEKMEFDLRWEDGLKLDSKVYALRRDKRIEQLHDLTRLTEGLDFDKIEPTHLRLFLATKFEDFPDILNTRTVLSGEIIGNGNSKRKAFAFIKKWSGGGQQQQQQRSFYRVILAICKENKTLSQKRQDTISIFLSLNVENETSSRLINSMSEIENAYIREYDTFRAIEDDNNNAPKTPIGFGVCFNHLTRRVIFPTLLDWYKKHLPWLPMTKDKLEVYVKTLVGRTHVVEVEVTDSILSLKKKISEKTGLFHYYQILIFGGRKLADTMTVGDYGIGIDSSTVYLTARLRGGVQICVKDSVGKRVFLEVSLMITVKMVKNLLQDKTGISPSQQKLSFNGKEMDDSRKLEDYNIKPGSVITIAYKFSGDVPLVSRSNFIDVDVVEMDVRAGERGCLVVMDGSDSITEYNVDFFVVNELQIGCLAGVNVAVRNPVYTQLEHPVSMNMSDQIAVRTIVENLSDDSFHDLFVSFGENDHLEFIDDTMIQKISHLPPHSATSLAWPVRPKEVCEKVGFDVDLVYKSCIIDKIMGGDRALVIEPYGDPFVKRVSSFILPGQGQSLEIDLGEDEQSAHATISLYSTSGAALFDNANRLAETPHGCCEQTFSSTLPNIILYEFLKKSNTLKGDMQSKLLKFMSKGKEHMMSNYVNEETGGVGLWNKHKTSVFHTALTLSLFGRLSEYILIPEIILERMTQYLLKAQLEDGGFQLAQGKYTPFPALLNQYATTAYILQALSFVKYEPSSSRKKHIFPAVKKAINWMEKNMGQYENDVTVLSLILDSMTRIMEGKFLEQHGGFAEILSSLIVKMQDESTGSWSTKSSSSLTSGKSHIENTSYCVLALGRYHGIEDDQRINKVVTEGLKYILRNRTTTGYYSTRDTCYAILALNEFSDVLFSLPDEEASILVEINGETYKEFKFREDMTTTECLNLSYRMKDIFVPFRQLKRNQKNLIEVKSINGMFVQCMIESSVYPPLSVYQRKEEEEVEMKNESIGDLKVEWKGEFFKVGEEVECIVEFKPQGGNKVQETLVFEIPIPAGMKCEKVLYDKSKIQSHVLKEKEGLLIVYPSSLTGEESVVVTVQCKAVFMGRMEQQPCKAYDMYNPQETLTTTRCKAGLEIA